MRCFEPPPATRFYAGVDLHARSLFLSILDRDGQERFARNLPAAPAPLKTTFTSPIFLPTISKAFRSAAPLIMAVPCWSSWKTGIFIVFLSASSI